VDGLASAGQSGSPPARDDWRSGFDFSSLDMDAGISGYRKARMKTRTIREFRRFGPAEAFLMSVRNMGIRVLYKVFRVRKKPDRGLVLAVSGVDGSGKSSMVDELRKWLSRDLDVEVLHLGKPSPVPLTFLLRPLLFLYRAMRGKLREGDDDAPGTFKQKNGLAWSLRYLALAYERYSLARRARKLAGKGRIVICDRYPTISPGKMDSPRIAPGGSGLVERMRQYELRLYRDIPKADGLIFLDVSLEEAIRRNRERVKKDKETDHEITSRHQDNQGLSFSARQVFLVDADRAYAGVLDSLKSIAWRCLFAGNGEQPVCASRERDRG
jgi:thymidylate kinase